jgi:hypothetical protein
MLFTWGDQLPPTVVPSKTLRTTQQLLVAENFSHARRRRVPNWGPPHQVSLKEICKSGSLHCNAASTIQGSVPELPRFSR